jgi:hypothetical protein
MADVDVMRLIRALTQRVNRLETKPAPLYLEGSYTPTYTGGTTAGTTTYTLQQGWYWRIGSVVLVTGLVLWTAATGTGDARISLPFVPSASVGFRASGGVRITTVTFTTTTPELILNPTNAFFTLESPVSNAAGNVVQMEAAGNITFSLFYGVD